MSGGGGGIIIIKNRLKAAAGDSAVQDHVHPTKKPRLVDLAGADVTSWSDEDVHFVLRRIAEAYDDQC